MFLHSIRSKKFSLSRVWSSRLRPRNGRFSVQSWSKNINGWTERTREPPANGCRVVKPSSSQAALHASYIMNVARPHKSYNHPHSLSLSHGLGAWPRVHPLSPFCSYTRLIACIRYLQPQPRCPCKAPARVGLGTPEHLDRLPDMIEATGTASVGHATQGRIRRLSILRVNPSPSLSCAYFRDWPPFLVPRTSGLTVSSHQSCDINTARSFVRRWRHECVTTKSVEP